MDNIRKKRGAKGKQSGGTGVFVCVMSESASWIARVGA